MAIKEISPRALTARYAVALGIIAVLSLSSHLVLEASLQSNEGTAAVINKSGRQRMLSQRIASLADQYRAGDLSARDELTKATDEFESANHFLLKTVEAQPVGSGNGAALQELYFSSVSALDAQVRNFTADARRVSELSPNDPAIEQPLARINGAAREALLTGLNRVVSIEQFDSEQRITHLEYLQWGILGVVLVTLSLEAGVIFRPMVRSIKDYTAELLRLATVDHLTGAANRRHFMVRCEAEIARNRRYGRPASILMLDIDHFKSINDTYGHAAGDAVLAVVGDVLRDMVRQIDIWGRMGGEEFAILLVETPLPGAAIVAERIRERFAKTSVDYEGKKIEFTVSIGCTAFWRDDMALDDGLRVADQLMYQAKQAGRNRVMVEAMA